MRKMMIKRAWIFIQLPLLYIVVGLAPVILLLLLGYIKIEMIKVSFFTVIVLFIGLLFQIETNALINRGWYAAKDIIKENVVKSQYIILCQVECGTTMLGNKYTGKFGDRNLENTKVYIVMCSDGNEKLMLLSAAPLDINEGEMYFVEYMENSGIVLSTEKIMSL